MKFLYVTHLSGKRINRLWLSAILAAKELGLDIHLACNMDEADEEEWNADCKKIGITSHQIDFNRQPLHYKNIKAYRQLLQLMRREKFDLVHCNTPIGGALGRICAQKAQIPQIIYMAHGFHFWKGAPLMNWLVYYPIERFLSYYSDVLITINEEDFLRASQFTRREVCRVHGVGVDIQKIQKEIAMNEYSKHDLGIPDNAFTIISIGELNNNKNQETLIRALELVKSFPIYYLVCGDGEKKGYLQELSNKLHVANRVLFLGFRDDIPNLLKMSDAFIILSKREGLSTALMEAMAVGLPCITSRIRGNVDLQGDSQYLFDCEDIEGLAKLLHRAYLKEGFDSEISRNSNIIKQYDIKNVIIEMKNIYLKCLYNIR